MISMEGVYYRYRKSPVELFNGLTQRFEPGTVTAITGASGVGKSTLLYLLGLLLTPTRGTISIDGMSTARQPDNARSAIRATRIGFVFQDAALDPHRSVLDNVTEGGLYSGMNLRESRRRAGDLLNSFGVLLRGTHRPGEVSGGQAQRIGLCRALLKRPTIVLADEPTGNLDEDSADLVLDILRGCADDGATVVISSHSLRVRERADSVITL